MDQFKPSPDVQSHATVPQEFQHIFLVTGPAGCGKTTVAQYLASQMNVPYIEGDDVSNFRIIAFLALTRATVPSTS